MKIKTIMRYDEWQKIFRCFAIICERGNVGDGQGFSAKITFGFERRLLKMKFSEGVEVTLLGVRVSYKQSYGGRFI